MTSTRSPIASPRSLGAILMIVLLCVAAALVIGTLVWQAVTANGSPDPTAANLSPGAAVVYAGVLVFREGLEAILVLAALTASLAREKRALYAPIASGVAVGFLATVATWFVVVAVLSAVNAPEVDVQAATGLLAIVVLLIVMNWFFHKIYWTGWISLHNRKRRELIGTAEQVGLKARLGLCLLGFASIYREGVEVVLFLQDLRLKMGSSTVLDGVLIGLLLTILVGWLTFVAHERLPYKRMLVLTGVMLGFVLLVMVGESAQELQQAGWIGTTQLDWPIPDWLGVWFSVFPNVESLAAQLVAAILVLGSYFGAQYLRIWRPRAQAEGQAAAH
jgi:high-affinity iron transporter